MTVRVDELTTDVSVEGAQSRSGAGDPASESAPHWAQAEQLRALQERVARDAARTSAEAYSD